MVDPSSMDHIDDAMRAFVRALPKTETHLHIEGALRWDLLQRAQPDKYQEFPASWDPNFRFRDFAHFESELLAYAADYFISADRYHENAKQVFQNHLKQNVKYVETSFASGCIEFFKLDAREVLDAILDAVPDGLEVRVFMGIHHSGYTEKMAPVINEALTWDQLSGIDIHGPEDEPIGDWAPSVYEKAKTAGKYTKAHAGEFMGPEFIRYAVEELVVDRIEHGVRIVEDPQLVESVKGRGIALDVCPISNVKLGVAACAQSHSIRELLDAGVCCTLSTDDPVSFGNAIDDEYLFLAQNEHFSRKELIQLAKNGFEVALLAENAKKAYLAELNHIESMLNG